ncbi:MAG: TMEM165/GDT1 family protein [Candidatus Woesearchaeota archaeon]
MIEAFLIPFATIALAEMGDKTQLLLLAFAARHASVKAYLGAVLGFLFADAVGVIFGATALNAIPDNLMKLIAGTIFLAFGIMALINAGGKEEAKVKGSAFLQAFLLVAVAEFGDKSQIAAAIFAAEYNPVLVFLGVTSALALVTIASFLIGKQLAKLVKGSTIRVASGILFIAIALATFASLLY